MKAAIVDCLPVDALFSLEVALLLITLKVSVQARAYHGYAPGKEG